MRRAISWEYWAPKSRTTIDWVSTDECLKSESKCKGDRCWLLALSCCISDAGEMQDDPMLAVDAMRKASCCELTTEILRSAQDDSVNVSRRLRSLVASWNVAEDQFGCVDCRARVSVGIEIRAVLGQRWLRRLSTHWRVWHFYHCYVCRQASHVQKICYGEVKKSYQQHAAQHYARGQDRGES